MKLRFRLFLFLDFSGSIWCQQLQIQDAGQTKSINRRLSSIIINLHPQTSMNNHTKSTTLHVYRCLTDIVNCGESTTNVNHFRFDRGLTTIVNVRQTSILAIIHQTASVTVNGQTPVKRPNLHVKTVQSRSYPNDGNRPHLEFYLVAEQR